MGQIVPAAGFLGRSGGGTISCSGRGLTTDNSAARCRLTVFTGCCPG